MTEASLGEVLDGLAATIDERGNADPAQSYTAKLLSEGPARCARKFGEEATEAVIAAVLGDKRDLSGEAADVIYHLLVMLQSVGVSPVDVAKDLKSRQGVSGIDEKASRQS